MGKNVWSYLVLIDQPHVFGDSLFVIRLGLDFCYFLQVQPRKTQLLFTFRDFNVEIDEALQKYERLSSKDYLVRCTNPDEDVHDHRRREDLGTASSGDFVDIFHNLHALATFN